MLLLMILLLQVDIPLREAGKRAVDLTWPVSQRFAAYEGGSPFRADIAATKEYIVLAHDVGASGVKVRPNGLPPEVPKEKTLEQIGKALIPCGQTAASLGLEVWVEVHGGGGRTAAVAAVRPR